MIAARGIAKKYRPLTAVNDLSFEVGRGEVVGFLGPNRAGKTTTLRMLAGTLQPDAGEIQFDGRPIGEALTEAKGRVGYLSESNALYPEMLVSEDRAPPPLVFESEVGQAALKLGEPDRRAVAVRRVRRHASRAPSSIG